MLLRPATRDQLAVGVGAADGYHPHSE
jgi:hypothetical protein